MIVDLLIGIAIFLYGIREYDAGSGKRTFCNIILIYMIILVGMRLVLLLSLNGHFGEMTPFQESLSTAILIASLPYYSASGFYGLWAVIVYLRNR